ncbi:hypothetical protein HBI17_177080 [Parastagonospora nodorum]|nr:hypothetical protein HBH49_108780 [Parastagonospora nodorum]KAH5740698.1 hypothetical protein HBI17_177080 [Parastagonospora nodorum]
MPRPALTYSIGRTLNAQRWHPRPLTTISRITTKCIHIPTRPAERFSRRVLQFEHLGARFCCLPTCHTRFCASPPFGLLRCDDATADFRWSFISHIHQRALPNTTPHDNDIVADRTRLPHRRDSLYLIPARKG